MKFYAIKTQSDNPQKPEGMPDKWPWLEKEIQIDEIDGAKKFGWTVFSADEYKTYLKRYQLDFDAYYQNYVAKDPALVLRVIDLVKDEFKFYHPSKIDFRRHLKTNINLNKTVKMLKNGRPERAEYFYDGQKICEIKFEFVVDPLNFVRVRTEFLGYFNRSGEVLDYWPIHQKIYDPMNIKDLTDMINERYEARVIIFDEIKAILNQFLAQKYLLAQNDEDKKTYPEILEIAGSFWSKYSNLIDAWFNTGTPKLRNDVLADQDEPLLDEVLPSVLIQMPEAMSVRDYIADRITY